MSTDNNPECPVLDVLGMATDAAKQKLGTDGANRRVTAKVVMATEVVENGQKYCNTVDATVTLGVHSSDGAADTGCCCLDKSCCCCSQN